MSFKGYKPGYGFNVGRDPQWLAFYPGETQARIVPGDLYVWYGPDIWPDNEDPCVDFLEGVAPEHEEIVTFMVEAANKRLKNGS